MSEVSFGAWAIGGSWGSVSDEESLAALHRAVDLGVNFFDTADVYGDGRSERLIARLRGERPRDTIYVATKAGRRLNPHTAAGYNKENLTGFVERSLQNLQVEALDLLQLHCPPPEVYESEAVFGVLDELVAAGKVRHYGVSVETVEQGLRAIEFPGVQTVQIIFNALRLKPTEAFLPRCVEKRVGVLARVPLASGLLSGKITRETAFAEDDHRHFNRTGEAFDAGETFSGLGAHLEEAFAAVDALRMLVPAGQTLAQFALRWILMSEGVTCAIPGAKRPAQVEENAMASDLPALPPETMQAVRAVYDRYVREHVHGRW